MRSCLCLLLLTLLVSLGHAQDRLYPNTFPLSDVKLLDGPFKHARDLNLQVLLKYDVDRLLAPYRKEAGLPPKAESYPNWIGLDGHLGGHYLSAMALNYAATGDTACRRRMLYMLAELKACQEANTRNNPDWGDGYLGGMPGSKTVWSGVHKGDLGPYRAAWAPWYNIHKMYAGLRDAWLYAGNEEARLMFLRFCDWGIALTAPLSDSLMQAMLDAEHGGMPEMFADAYQMTGDPRYITAARRFSHRMLLDAMAAGIDNLDNKHGNTQIPKVVGFQRIAELTGDSAFVRAAAFFWERVTKFRSLAFGGHGRKESFPAASACDDYVHEPEGPESCNSYNMLKLTEDLFRATPSAAYADYYERTLYNHILSSQHPSHGGYVYFTPARPRHYRVYSAPNKAMWCCVGTGMENHSKYNQLIFSHRHDTLFLNLFVAAELNWKEKGVALRQETSFPSEEQTKLTVLRGSSRFTLMVRYPSWVPAGALTIDVNGRARAVSSGPSSYIAVDRAWTAGDVVKIGLPMRNSVEPLPNVPAWLAFLHGPILLAAKTGTEDLAGLIADDDRFGNSPAGKRLPLEKAPIIVHDDLTDVPRILQPVKGEPLKFTIPAASLVNPAPLVLEPFYQVHDARYMMYWLTLSGKQYRAYLDSIAAAVRERSALQERTVDAVSPGDRQPETEHAMRSEKSHTGTYLDENWRDAADSGFFSYRMATGGESDLLLLVRYWGFEWGPRRFSVCIDDKTLLTEDNTDRRYQAKFRDVAYEIPAAMLQGKDHIQVKFQALPGNTAGAVYAVRLVRKSPSGKSSG